MINFKAEECGWSLKLDSRLRVNFKHKGKSLSYKANA
jgi:hypothetical protein